MRKELVIPSDDALLSMEQSKLRALAMAAMNQKQKAAMEDRWSAYQRWSELLLKCQKLINDNRGTI
jgi:hypothetical protein